MAKKRQVIEWIEAKAGSMPEDYLPHKRISGKSCVCPDREVTELVLVVRTGRERIDCCRRVHFLDRNQWYWMDGDGITPITHWSTYTRPWQWDEKKHQKEIKEMQLEIKKRKEEADKCRDRFTY